MSLSRTFNRALVIALLVVAVFAPAAFAQDMDAMAKWSAATIIKWRIAGEFTGTTVILSGATFTRSAEVTDRVELEFDWDQTEMKVVGKPVIRNFSTKIGALTPGPTTFGECPAPRIEGTLEFLTAVAVKEAMGNPAIEVKREQPGGAIPYPGARATGKCGDAWETAAPKVELTTLGIPVAPPMMLAMPPRRSAVTISKDGKSFVSTAEGWVWTMTPAIVK